MPVPAIVHMDLDTFFVSVERLLDSRLEGKPVLIGGTSPRGVVASCSYEARKFGIHSGMPMRSAMNMCPEAVILRGDTANYSMYSNMVTEIIKETVPVYEKSSIDEFYIDMTGMDKFFNAYSMTKELQNRIYKETRLPISFGFATSKTVAKMATNEGKPKGSLQILPGQEKTFLAPLATKKIPMVGEQTYKTLCELGLAKIETVQQMPRKLMKIALGKNGESIWKKANGIDFSKVVPYTERKSISVERTFQEDTIDLKKLKHTLIAMTENLAFQLRKNNKLTENISVKIRYSDFTTHTIQSSIAYTSADHLLIPKVFDLFDRLFQKRLLIRLVGVRFSHLVGGGHQINLFDDVEEMINLYNAMDYIRAKHGERVIMRASGMGARSIGKIMNPFKGDDSALPPAHREF